MAFKECFDGNLSLFDPPPKKKKKCTRRHLGSIYSWDGHGAENNLLPTYRFVTDTESMGVPKYSTGFHPHLGAEQLTRKEKRG